MLSFGDLLKIFALAGIIVALCSMGLVIASDKSTDTAIKEATEQTMYESINMGCLRVDEAITIDTEYAKSIFADKYKNLTNYEDGYTDLILHKSEGVSPMIASEAYQIIETPIHRVFKLLNRDLERGYTARTWENNIGIFEATATVKPASAEYFTTTATGDKVDDFQCYE